MVEIFLTVIAGCFLAIPAIILGFIAALLGLIIFLIASGILGFVLFWAISLLITLFS